MSGFDVKQFIGKTGEWLKGTGPDHDIVISSRVRLARNIESLNFPTCLDDKGAAEVIERVLEAIKQSNFLKTNLYVPFEALSDFDKQLLLERHLVSKELIEERTRCGLSFSKDEIVSLMINEEDHLRMQVLQSGFKLMEAWRLIDQIDSDLESKLQFSFHKTLGYMTACPTNVGTGLRASCMLHLPALVMTKQITKVVQAVAKLNLTVRGLYGEGTQALGNFFQLSNQGTIGKSEDVIVENIEKVIRQVIEHEREARKKLFKKRKEKLCDQIWRAVGILKAVRLIQSQESTALLSMVRLGIDLNVISGLDSMVLNELFIYTQPAHLQLIAKDTQGPEARDKKRAGLIRDYLKNVLL